MRLIDRYVVCWVLAEIGVVAATAAAPTWIRVLAAIGVTFRIVEILQSTGNLFVFDGLRQIRKRNRVASSERIVVLLLINWVELAVCFGLLYQAAQTSIAGRTSWLDPYYLSVMTQTTVGYGDRYPVTAAGRAIAIALMVAGVGMFGALSGIIASLFVGGQESEEKAVAAELQALRTEIERLRLSTQPGAGPDP